jgi:chromosome segregation ATPase
MAGIATPDLRAIEARVQQAQNTLAAKRARLEELQAQGRYGYQLRMSKQAIAIAEDKLSEVKKELSEGTAAETKIRELESRRAALGRDVEEAVTVRNDLIRQARQKPTLAGTTPRGTAAPNAKMQELRARAEMLKEQIRLQTEAMKPGTVLRYSASAGKGRNWEVGKVVAGDEPGSRSRCRCRRLRRNARLEKWLTG